MKVALHAWYWGNLCYLLGLGLAIWARDNYRFYRWDAVSSNLKLARAIRESGYRCIGHHTVHHCPPPRLYTTFLTPYSCSCRTCLRGAAPAYHATRLSAAPHCTSPYQPVHQEKEALLPLPAQAATEAESSKAGSTKASPTAARLVHLRRGCS